MAVPQSPSIRERACPRGQDLHRHVQQNGEGGGNWTYSAESTGPRTITTSPSPTVTGSCWPASGSATTRPAGACWTCSPSTATARTPRPVAIETPRGLLVACLRATGRKVYPLNPMSVARYRDRHRSQAGNPTTATRSSWPTYCAPTCTPTGRCPPTASSPRPSRSSPAPSRTRLGPHHRAQQAPLPPARVLSRVPAAFAGARDGIMRPEARVILAAAPDPASAAKLTSPAARPAEEGRPQARHRRRGTAAARSLPHGADAPASPRRAGHGKAEHRAAAPARRRVRQRDELGQAATEFFNQHPDAGIITSFPGIGALTGARVLAEIGDDRSRFQDARGLKAYAGSAPVTRSSGKSRSVTHRRVKNNRLAAAGYTWAFAALTASPGAAPTTTAAATAATGTAPPSAICSTACSAASTTASPPASTTTRPQHSPARQPRRLQPDTGNLCWLLDNLIASDVSSPATRRTGSPLPRPADHLLCQLRLRRERTSSPIPAARQRSRSDVHFSGRYSSRSISARPPSGVT